MDIFSISHSAFHDGSDKQSWQAASYILDIFINGSVKIAKLASVSVAGENKINKFK